MKKVIIKLYNDGFKITTPNGRPVSEGPRSGAKRIIEDFRNRGCEVATVNYADEGVDHAD